MSDGVTGHSESGSTLPLSQDRARYKKRYGYFYGRTPGSGRNVRRVKRRIAGLPWGGVRPARYRGTFTNNLRVNCMSFADGRLFFLRPLMPRGHFLSCATKKESKEVAGNAIPRSRLTSAREIAHSRASNLYPYFGTR